MREQQERECGPADPRPRPFLRFIAHAVTVSRVRGSSVPVPYRSHYLQDRERAQNDHKAGEGPRPFFGEQSPQENRHQPKKGDVDSDPNRDEPIDAHAVILAADSAQVY
jgi:hypothetical protein